MTSLPNPAVASSALGVEKGVELGAGVEEWVETEFAGLAGASLGARVGVDVLLGVGVDMVDAGQLAEMIESSGSSFMDLCWTPSEQGYCAGSIPRLAARWAAKEATMKALGRGIGEIDPIDIEVVSIEGEPPLLELHGSARAIARERWVRRVALSLTHEGTFAVAFVVVVGEAVDPVTGTATGVGIGTPVGSRRR
ncbi:holo-ACP synthase [Aeromicrobium endophyticum]|uniref:Holo-[acyl-carrier-protein] synthase n=1 Tax=Aeromicrobium endophyticum TaxID=2292704 RepID=A0A371P3F6_9ACTN|nr:holo-ACP synthase [Aeromicrobium endophyticum]REK70473.1 holo-ACP synthase [Aeromicrobium endophyticum]